MPLNIPNTHQERTKIESDKLNANNTAIKNFVDDLESDLDTKVSKSGDTITGNLSFNTGLAQILNLWGTTFGIGMQDSRMYFRAGVGGYDGFQFYQGGVHSSDADDPGTGGISLLKLTPNAFQYKNQDVYHSGNLHPTNVRQSRLYAPKNSSGIPNYFTSTGLALAANFSTASPFVATVAKGFDSNGNQVDKSVYISNSITLNGNNDNLYPNTTNIIMCDINSKVLRFYNTANSFYVEGPTRPSTSGYVCGFWYDTNTQTMQMYTDSAWGGSDSIYLGKVTTDSTSVTKIEYAPIVNENWNNNNLPLTKLGVIDYSAGVTATLPYTAPADGQFFVHTDQYSNDGRLSLAINNFTYNIGGCAFGISGGGASNANFRLSKGDIVSISSSAGSYTANYTFFPFKGVI